jgi:hypothetical protein
VLGCDARAERAACFCGTCNSNLRVRFVTIDSIQGETYSFPTGHCKYSGIHLETLQPLLPVAPNLCVSFAQQNCQAPEILLSFLAKQAKLLYIFASESSLQERGVRNMILR